MSSSRTLFLAVCLAVLPVAAPAGAHVPTRSLEDVESAALGAAHAAEHARLRAAPDTRTPTRVRASGPASRVGAWTVPPFKLPTYAIHAALLPTGKVLLWGYPVRDRNGTGANNHGDGWLWDPSRGTGPEAFRAVPPPEVVIDGVSRVAPIYCTGQSFLPNGNLLITGGNLDLNGNRGLDLVMTFDPYAERWHVQGSLADGRWYPGQETLPDGRVIIAGGYTKQGAGNDNHTMELWPARDVPVPRSDRRDAAGLRSEVLPGSATRPVGPGLYPHLFTLPSGRVLLAGPGATDSARLDMTTLTWTELGQLPPGRDRVGGNAVLLPDSDRVVLVGGYDYPTYRDSGMGRSDATADVIAIDGDAPKATWRTVGRQSVSRAYGNTVLLPDRSLLTVGGGGGRADPGGGTYWLGDDPAPRLNAELLPAGATDWLVGPPQQHYRGYHSVALMLPDGRVLSAGDDAREDAVRTDDVWIGNAEIYTPPYLLRGTARPRVTAAPPALERGIAFTVRSPDPGRIAKVVLIAPSATTHGADMTQRMVTLDVVRRGRGTLTVAGPPGAARAPAGPYMLFALTRDGTPSIARWTRVDGLAGDRTHLIASVSSARRGTVARSRRLDVLLEASGPVSGTVRATVAGRTLARATFVADDAGRRTLRLRLSPTAARRLRSARSPRVVLRVAAGAARVQTRSRALG